MTIVLQSRKNSAIVEELYHQKLEWYLDPSLWREVEIPMRDVIKEFPGIQGWWCAYSDWFGKSFVNYVNQLQQIDERPSSYRQPVQINDLANRQSQRSVFQLAHISARRSPPLGRDD